MTEIKVHVTTETLAKLITSDMTGEPAFTLDLAEEDYSYVQDVELRGDAIKVTMGNGQRFLVNITPMEDES